MEIWLVLAILVCAAALFASERYPVDQVALIVLAALLLLGLVTPAEGLSGFSNPATVTVAAMFVLSAGLGRTGAVAAIGRMLVRFGRGEVTLLVLIMVSVGVVSAFINNTGAVAVMLPIVIAAAAARKVSPSRLLIPLSYASQFGGVCTLIGTSTNLLVSAISDSAGYGAFSMFEFGLLGLAMFAAGTLYVLTVGRFLLPRRRGGQLSEDYGLGEYVTELRVMEDSPLAGRSIAESELEKNHGVHVIELLRDDSRIWSPAAHKLQAGDVLLVRAKVRELLNLKADARLEVDQEFKVRDEALKDEELAMVEVLVAPRSRLVGNTLSGLEFHRRYSAVVLGVQRRGEMLREKFNEVRLNFGDALLLLGPKDDIERLRGDPDLIVLDEVTGPGLHAGKAPFALLVVAGVVAAASTGLAPIVVAALVGCVVLLLLRCITLEDAYTAIDWRVIFLLAGILPLGIAMQNSGAAQLIADHAIAVSGQFGPIAMLAALYLLTALLTEAMSNNASAVLLAPIAIAAAEGLGVDPKPFLMAVTFAASTSFATPVGYQTNTMVYSAGGYRFSDFLKVGVPLNIVFAILAVVLIPLIWPFRAA